MALSGVHVELGNAELTTAKRSLRILRAKIATFADDNFRMDSSRLGSSSFDFFKILSQDALELVKLVCKQMAMRLHFWGEMTEFYL